MYNFARLRLQAVSDILHADLNRPVPALPVAVFINAKQTIIRCVLFHVELALLILAFAVT